MKNKLILSCIAAVFFSSVGVAADLTPVPVRITSQQFEPGDSITIQDVVASSAEMKVGDTVIVRGSYSLKSKPSGALGFFLTTKGPSAATAISPGQQMKIEAGSGTFELKHVIPAEGSLHISFYPEPSGSSFGGVYFGASKR
ncbi:MAG: hypothetical protein ABIO94_09185 [Opitutaceae bacterium]